MVQVSPSTRAKWKSRCPLFALFLALLLSISWSSDHLEVQENLPLQQNKLVTFVTPSRLSRNSLHDTISSLQNQTVSLWRAVIGVDITASLYKSQRDVDEQLRNKFGTEENDNFILLSSEKDDTRLKFVAIDTQSTVRGQNENGAGRVRNFLIRQYVDTEWVAFVDDDDTLGPYYVQKLQHVIHQHSNADVIVFRMRYRKSGKFVPPYANVKNGTLWPSTVGISFAVKRSLFVSPDNPIVFESNHLEDFLFIKKAFHSHKTVILTTCIEYYIRSLPYVKTVNENSCECFPLLQVWDAIPGQVPPTVV